MKSPEYVCISGVARGDDGHLRKLYEATRLPGTRLLQLGVKATHKSQYLGQDTRYGSRWFPVGDEIDDAIYEVGSGITGVAQLYMDAEQLSSSRYLRLFMPLALGRASNRWLTGVQFDMFPWYDRPDVLRDTVECGAMSLAQDGERLTVTLQCQGDIMSRHTPRNIAKRLGEFVGHIDYVLFDSSHGQGKRIDTQALLPYLDAVRNETQLDALGIGVAGGLNAEVVRAELPKLLRYFPNLSWYAEGQLHPTAPTGDRPLDITVCQEYLEASAEILDTL